MIILALLIILAGAVTLWFSIFGVELHHKMQASGLEDPPLPTVSQE